VAAIRYTARAVGCDERLIGVVEEWRYLGGVCLVIWPKRRLNCLDGCLVGCGPRDPGPGRQEPGLRPSGPGVELPLERCSGRSR
jgi:hypothetical protein